MMSFIKGDVVFYTPPNQTAPNRFVGIVLGHSSSKSKWEIMWFTKGARNSPITSFHDRETLELIGYVGPPESNSPIMRVY